MASATSLIDYTQQNADNSHTRFVIYGPWTIRSGDYTSLWEQNSTTNDSTGTQRKRAYYQEVYNRVSAARPGANVSLLMTGELFYLIDQEIKSQVANGGNWLGYTNVDQLYRDDVHLDHEEGRWLASLAMWSAITGEDPSGLTRPSGTFGSSLDNVTLRNGLSSFVSEHMDEFYIAPVPEPGALGLLASAALAMLSRRRTGRASPSPW